MERQKTKERQTRMEERETRMKERKDEEKKVRKGSKYTRHKSVLVGQKGEVLRTDQRTNGSTDQ